MKFARNSENLPDLYQKKVNLNSPTGLNGTHLPESIPAIDRASQDMIYQNKNGSIIRLGPDRPGNRISGYGGAGHNGTATVDIFVGPQSSASGKVNANMYCNPDMSADSARIYLSQKTDVDRNFGISSGEVGNPEGLSAFAVKADSCRMISRYGIKLVTAIDDQNSIGANTTAVRGIELIAGNAEGTYRPAGYSKEIKYLQPIPKGQNLVLYFRELTERIDKLSAIVSKFVEIQTTYNRLFANHTHFNIPPTPTTPGIAKTNDVLKIVHAGLSQMLAASVQESNSQNRKNISAMNKNFLDEDGALCINSKHNRTT